MITVAICTHNPRRDYLQRALNALRQQTLPLKQWELLLIDNASAVELTNEYDLSWHPLARRLREERIGLTYARMRAILEAKSDLLVFVDDDNVLDKDYLAIGAQIGDRMPFLGAWGGQLLAEFETAPPDWSREYLGMLAIREFDSDRWSNLKISLDTVPAGAGLCVRLSVAQRWRDNTAGNQRRSSLGRSGNALGSAEDTDLALTACDMGLGTGLFQDLRLTHLIPAGRLKDSYLEALAEKMSYSHVILQSLRSTEQVQPQLSLYRRMVCWVRLRQQPAVVRRIERARERGYREGLKVIGVE
ncbi:MAG: glycosyltransferase [Terracidiphilus sp.]|nr:glycosyltransferase [Terracidiphilus sp.]